MSTRNHTDSYTPFRALCEERAADGGMFVPMNLPVFSEEEILKLKENSFGENVACILNKFFSANLNGWDVEFCIGRHPFKLIAMNHRLLIAEMWRNLEERYQYLESSLFHKLTGKSTLEPTGWAKIAIGIAVLFGLYGELLRKRISAVDIAVNAVGFSAPMAAWYARQMGLPIGTIICGCNESSAVWDLIHRGEFSTTAGARTGENSGIERLLFAVFGQKEALRFAQSCKKHGVYHVEEEALTRLNAGLYAAVVSERRVNTVLSSICRSNDYITEPQAALVYGGLQDYRARTGESRLTLLLSERSPMLDADKIGGILGVSTDDIKKRIHNA